MADPNAVPPGAGTGENNPAPAPPRFNTMRVTNNNQVIS